MYQASWFCSYTLHANYVKYVIMAYGTPYVGMTLEKNGSHIKSAQIN